MLKQIHRIHTQSKFHVEARRNTCLCMLTEFGFAKLCSKYLMNSVRKFSINNDQFDDDMTD